MARQSYSIVEYHGRQERYKCGYCKSSNTSYSEGMWAHMLTVQDYQALIDRGWRRSGCYCYKPMMDKTCCPLYTIKCEALNFKISKSQKKILKRMAKFLKNELQKDDMDTLEEDRRDRIDINIGEISNYKTHLKRAEANASKINVSSMKNEINGKLQSIPVATNQESRIPSSSIDKECKTATTTTTLPVSNNSAEMHVGSEGTKTLEATDKNSSRPPCKKAKILRMERKQNKLLAQGKSAEEVESILKEDKQHTRVKSLEEFFKEINEGTRKLTTKLVRVMSEEFLETLDESASLYKKYQMAIHGDRPEECDRTSFFNFLVKSPLQPWTPENGPPQGYGSFHEQYWLDDELIAVGVIDILPSCISSVYFFYDPAYSQLSLGTFSSLREVCLTRQLNKLANNLMYYYMGFYIHTCPKMRYKARMRPSRLLCPETYVWCDIDPCLAKLDKEKYSRLNDDLDAIDEDGIVDIQKVLVLYCEIGMPYHIYKAHVHGQISEEEEDEIKEYAVHVGMKCAQSLLLFRS